MPDQRAASWNSMGRGRSADLASTERSPECPNMVGPSAICCCIESGVLEAQTIIMAETVRRFAGRLSEAPIIAVRPRIGPPLASSTKAALQRLRVELVERNTNTEFAWQHYTNKVLALLAAEDVVKARQYIWLDSDVLVLAEPEPLFLAADEDFVACVPDKGAIGSTGPSDPADALWGRVCNTVGIPLESLPWVNTFCQASTIRFYMNDGIFAYRGGVGFAQAYAEDCFSYLRAKQSKSHPEVHFTSQILIGLTVLRQGLRWRLLPHSCNYGAHSKLLDWIKPDELASAIIVHYHDMLDAPHWPALCDLFRKAQHPLLPELSRLGPLHDPGGPVVKAARETLRIIRGYRRRRYYKACGFNR